MKKHKQKRASAARVRNVSDYQALPYREQERRLKALKVLSRMRTEQSSLTSIAREVGITPNAARQILGNSLIKSGGKYRAKPGDQLLRVFNLPDINLGRVNVAVRGSRNARVISDYDNALRSYIYTGNASGLKRFQGVTIPGGKAAFLTDLRQIDRMARRHELSYESIYAGAT